MVDTSQLPTFQLDTGEAPAAPQQSNAVVAGLKSGTLSAVGGLAGAAEAGLRALGVQHGVAIPGTDRTIFDPDAAGASAKSYSDAAAAAGRPDLDQAGFFNNGVGGFFSKAAYEVAKSLPVMTAAGLAAVGTGGAAIPEEVGALGLAGRAAQVARGAIGGAAVTVPESIGEQQEAIDKAGQQGQGTSLRAIAQGVPAGLIQAVGPAFDAGLISKAFTDSVGKRVAMGALTQGAAGALGAGVQTAADTSFDPNISAGDRAQQILSSAASGAIFGGLMGGAFGLIPGHADGKNPGNAATSDIEAATRGVDPTLQLTGPSTPQPGEPIQASAPPDLLRLTYQDPQGKLDLQQPQSTGPSQPIGPQPEQPGLFDQRTADAPATSQVTDPDATFHDRLMQILGRDTDTSNLPPLADRISLADRDAARETAGVGTEAQTAPQLSDDIEAQLSGERPATGTGQVLSVDRNASAAQQLVASLRDPDDASIMNPSLTDQLKGVGLDALANAGPERGDAPLPTLADAESAAALQRDLVKLRTFAPDAYAKRFGLTSDLDANSNPSPMANHDAPMRTAQALALGDQDGTKLDLMKQFGDRDNQIGSRGVMRDWINDADVRNDAELYNAMQDEVQANSKVTRTSGFKRMAQEIGLYGEDNKPLDMAQERADVAQIPNAQARAAASAQLDALADRQARAAALRDPDQTPQAVTVGTAPHVADLLAGADGSAGTLPQANDVVSRNAPSTTAPVSIADRVVNAAHDLSGGTGGDVKIADLRKALPDVAPKDFEAALRDIHSDDTGNALTQAPKGQRAGVDGISVPGQAGKFHNLTVEPREDTTARNNYVEQNVRDAMWDKGARGREGDSNTIKELLKDRTSDMSVDEYQGAIDRMTQRGEITQRGDGTYTRGENHPDAIQERSAAAQDVRDRSAGGSQDGGGNTVEPTTAAAERQQGGGEVAHPTNEAVNAGKDTAGVPKAVGKSRRELAMDKARAELKARADAGENVRATNDGRALSARNPNSMIGKRGYTGRLSSQTEEGRQVNSLVDQLNARQGLRPNNPARQGVGVRPVDREVVGGTPADLAKSMAEVPPKAPPISTGEPDIRPLMTKDVGRPIDATPEEQRGFFNDATANLKQEIKDRIKLIDNAGSLPDRIKNLAKVQGLDLNQVPALHFGDNVYLHADQLRNRQDVEDMIAHEVLGHMGTAEQLGRNGSDRYTNTLASIFDRMGGMRGLTNLAKKYGMWDNPEYGLSQYVRGDETTAAGKARLVDELLAHASQSRLFGNEQRGMLAIVGRIKQAIVDMFRKAGLDGMAERFNGFGMADVEKFLQDSRNLLEGKPPEGTIDLSQIPDARLNMLLKDNKEFIMPAQRKQSVQDQLDDVTSVTRAMQAIESVATSDLAKGVYRKAGDIRRLFMTTQDMIRAYDGKFNGLFSKDNLANKLAAIVGTRVTQWKTQTYKQLNLIKGAYRDTYDQFVNLVHSASINHLDPERPFSEHTWLTDRTDGQRAKLEEEHAKLVDLWNKLGQPSKGGVQLNMHDLYRNMQAGLKADQYLHFTNRLHSAVDTLFDGNVAGFEKNAVHEVATRTDIHNDPNAAYAFAKQAYDTRVAALKAHILTDKTVDPETGGIVRSMLRGLDDANERMGQSPYTHLGRSGDFFTRFKLAGDKDGPHADAVDAIRALAEEHGLGDAQFNSVGSNRSVFIRTQSEANAREFYNAVRLLGDDVIDFNEAPSAGSLLNERDWQASEVAPELKKLIDKIASKYEEGPHRDSAIRELRGAWFDALPEDSAIKGGAQRMNVNGFSGDMLKNLMFRDAVSGNAIGRMSVMAQRAEYASQIVARMRDAQHGDFDTGVDLKHIGQGFLERNAAQTSRVQSGLFDKMRGAAHGFYLAASPGYFLMQLAQTYTLTMPELARNFGFQKSMGAMAASSRDVGIVLAAMAKVQHEVYGAWKQGQALEATSGISQRALRIAQEMGLSKDKADFLQQLDNMGKLEMGTFAHENFAGLDRELGAGYRGAVSSAGAKALQMLNSTATGSELAARLVAAMSAKRLHDGATATGKLPPGLKKFETVHDYAGHVVSESMFEWGGEETSKGFSKQGIFGSLSPLALQFHGFSTRLFNKLVTEGYNAFKGDTPAERAEARAFMLSHLTAATTLAGTMGLPAAAWTAAAITKASTLMPGSGGEAYDVESHYKDFLASVFGKGLGQVISGGLPRFFNADFSDLGDKDLLPAQSLLEDRRKLEDSIPDYLSKAWGSSIGIGVNGLLGARDILNGRPLNGMARIMPTAIRDQLRAYQISQYGYTDSSGNRMPIDAGAMAVLRQALGIQGGEITEEREKKLAMEGAKEDRAFHAGVIKRNAAIAYENNDTDGYAHWMSEAQKYDSDPNHRGMPISSSVGSYIRSRAMARAYAQSSGLPLGTSPRDLPALQLLKY